MVVERQTVHIILQVLSVPVHPRIGIESVGDATQLLAVAFHADLILLDICQLQLVPAVLAHQRVHLGQRRSQQLQRTQTPLLILLIKLYSHTTHHHTHPFQLRSALLHHLTRRIWSDYRIYQSFYRQTTRDPHKSRRCKTRARYTLCH